MKNMKFKTEENPDFFFPSCPFLLFLVDKSGFKKKILTRKDRMSRKLKYKTFQAIFELFHIKVDQKAFI